MVSIESLPFRKLFIDKVAGPDSQLPYRNCSLLSENLQTGQELLLLLMRPLPLESKQPYLCPPYVIAAMWKQSVAQGAIRTH